MFVLEYADHDDKIFYTSHNLDEALEFQFFLHMTFHEDIYTKEIMENTKCKMEK